MATLRTWSKRNKLMLLKGVKKYGHTNIAEISKLIPDKSPECIKAMINKYIALARVTNEKNENHYKRWLNPELFPPTETVIPQALLYIYLFEKYPKDPKYDYRQIYYFLYQIMLGNPPIDLPLKQRKILYNLLSEITSEIWPKCQSEIVDYVGNLYKKLRAKRVYPGKK
ncbi:uncharacterized protein [Prorops nasuta]|uniref:uncharacterized protein n=1 Tax=Prorops nasuta TaxID=863751 RepID=UPI0034CD2266